MTTNREASVCNSFCKSNWPVNSSYIFPIGGIVFRFSFLLIVLIGIGIGSAYAQIDIKGKLKEKTQSRTEQKVDEGIDKSLDKIEEGIGNLFKKKKKGTVKEEEEENEAVGQEQESEEAPESEETELSMAPQKPSLESFTQYDFVPGDMILFFEDFSQDAIGDFPALWSTNGSGEVKTVNISSDKWLHLNGEDAVYCYTKSIAFPDNFIVEFDIIPDKDYARGIMFTLYQDDVNNSAETNDDLYPGIGGLHVTPTIEGWETNGYHTDRDWLEGKGSKNPVVREEVNHVIIWVQKRRVRIYHGGAKVVDVPTNIYADTKFDRIRFSGWDRNSWPYITNFKITSAAPDTRSKLLTEGKLVSYGIYFDSGKDVVKPESYGAVKDIAVVLKENPSVRIKIVGHTDSDGDDGKNLDLSKRRAASVKNYLAGEFQIDAGRIETDGKGESVPVESNTSSAGKAKNRRVEFVKL